MTVDRSFQPLLFLPVHYLQHHLLEGVIIPLANKYPTCSCVFLSHQFPVELSYKIKKKCMRDNIASLDD